MGIMATEWRQLCNDGKIDFVGYIGMIIVVAIVFIVFMFDIATALIVMFSSALFVWLLLRLCGDQKEVGRGWTISGIILIGFTGGGLVWLREFGENGFQLAFWLVMSIWITDTFAYYLGRYFKGPKLAPTISPNKTWSGLIGGVLGTALWSGAWSYWTGTGCVLMLAVIGVGTAVLAQLGDLSVSVVKRRFGVKNTGNLIPGHGGVLDRMDGFLGAVPFVVLSLAVAKGNLLLWS
jgi:phosphatidate cytidylyltransferase